MERTQKIGDYIIYVDKKLGKGSFGTVYLGRSLVDGKLVAVKRFKYDEVHVVKEKIEQEIGILEVVRHENLIGLYNVYRQPERRVILLFTEYCEGTLVNYIERTTKNFLLPVDCVQHLMWQLGQGVAYLHHHNFLHRDLKPDNLLVKSFAHGNEYPVLKIADFGLARYVSPGDQAHTWVGSPLWISPEIFLCVDQSELKYDAKSEMWSIGIIMYELVYGRNPFLEAVDANDLKKRLQSDSISYMKPPFEGHLTMGAVNLLKRLLMLDPKKRLSIDQFLQDKYFDSIRMDKQVSNSKALSTQQQQQQQQQQKSIKNDENFKQEYTNKNTDNNTKMEEEGDIVKIIIKDILEKEDLIDEDIKKYVVIDKPPPNCQQPVGGVGTSEKNNSPKNDIQEVTPKTEATANSLTSRTPISYFCIIS